MRDASVCRFGDGAAVVIVAVDEGCLAFPHDRVQALCEHHARKATPLGGLRILFDWRVAEQQHIPLDRPDLLPRALLPERGRA